MDKKIIIYIVIAILVLALIIAAVFINIQKSDVKEIETNQNYSNMENEENDIAQEQIEDIENSIQEQITDTNILSQRQVKDTEASTEKQVTDSEALEQGKVNDSETSTEKQVTDSEALKQEQVKDSETSIKRQSKEEKIDMIKIKINNNVLDVKLEDNEATKSLVEKLKNGDISVKANEYGGFEKVGDLGFSLPRNDTSITTSTGDIVLYQGNQISLFYNSSSWSYTKLGKVKNVSSKELKNILGSGDVTLVLSFE